MSKKFTSLNPAHPHSRLVNFRQKMKSHYRTQTTPMLDAYIATVLREVVEPVVPFPLHRHDKLEFLIAKACAEFKVQWAEKYHWEFDDCYDDEKLRAAVMAMRNEKLRAEFPLRGETVLRADNDPPVVDLTCVCTPDGGTMTFEDCAQLEGEEKAAVRTYMNAVIAAIIKAGYGGSLPGLNGTLVDRRLHPQAIPLVYNTALNVPAAKAIFYGAPEGLVIEQCEYSLWEPFAYTFIAPSEKWVRVRLKDGTYDLEWTHADGLGMVGVHSENNIIAVQTCWEKQL